jgi:hypothetical protein
VKAKTAIGIQMPGDMTSSTHKFDGWNDKKDGKGKAVTEGTVPTKNMTVYGWWTEKDERTITVSFDSNFPTGATGTKVDANPKNVDLASGETSLGGNMPSVPTTGSHVWTSWNTEDDGSGTAFTGATTVTTNITVYAQWQEKPADKWTITFDYDGGTKGDPAPEYLFVSKSPAQAVGDDDWPEQPTKANYTFASWNEMNGMTMTDTVYAGNTTITKDVTLKVKWLANAQAPVLSELFSDYTWYQGNTPAKPYTVKAAVTDGGTLKFQWYLSYEENGTFNVLQNASGDVTEGIASYTPVFNVEDLDHPIRYVYCFVTNTNNNAAGTKTATARSDTVAVTLLSKISAENPVFGSKSEDREYDEGHIPSPIPAISVTYTPPASGGSLTYQWSYTKDSGTPATIQGATGASYTPTATIVSGLGLYSFTVVVTNTITPQETPSEVGTATATGSSTITITVSDANAAQYPTIVDPVDVDYAKGETIGALTVSASVTDGGTLTYQWYSNTTKANTGGTAITTGGTGPSFTPDINTNSITDVTPFYYYVLVTNPGPEGAWSRSRPSNVATVTIYPYAVAAAPKINGQPQSAEYPYTGSSIAVTPLVVDAESTDGGSLTYQWYSCNAAGTLGASIGAGGQSATYTPQISTDAAYFKVVVTNTNSKAKTKTATTESALVTITVKKPIISYTILGSGTSFTAEGGTLDPDAAATTMANVLSAIQADAKGIDVEIEFGKAPADGERTPISIGATASFSGAGWGAITLKGSVTSTLTGATTGTVTIGADVSVTIKGTIANTNTSTTTTPASAGKAVCISGANNTLEIANGATLSADGGNALYHLSSGKVTISGGLLTSANRNAANGTGKSVGTVCCEGIDTNLTISGGVVQNTFNPTDYGGVAVWISNTRSTSEGGDQPTMLTLAGGEIKVVGSRAVGIGGSTSVTFEGEGTTITGPNSPAAGYVQIAIINSSSNPWGIAKFIIGSSFDPPTDKIWRIYFANGAKPSNRATIEGGAPYRNNFYYGLSGTTLFTINGGDLW